MRNPLSVISDMSRLAHIKTNIAVMNRLDKQTPQQRRLMGVSASLTLLGLCVAEVAVAQSGGLAGMVDVGAQQADSIKPNLGKIFATAGFGCAGYGGYNWWRKGKEGEQSHIKGGQIAIPLLAGAALGATGFLLVKAGETVGIEGSAQGQIPQ